MSRFPVLSKYLGEVGLYLANEPLEPPEIQEPPPFSWFIPAGGGVWASCGFEPKDGGD